MGYYNKKEDANLEFKNWNVFFVKIHEKIFEISNLEPTIYYRKTSLLKYALEVKSLLTICSAYITDYKKEINELDKILDYITGETFMRSVLKEAKELYKNSDAIFIQEKNTIKLAKQIVKIFEYIQYNLSKYEILPKNKDKIKPKFAENLTEEESKYFDFINYIEN